MKSQTGKKHVKQADSDEKTALVLAAQLSDARKWRNSSNNQVTEALKSVPSPLSQDDLQKLGTKGSSSYTDAENAFQSASGASNSVSAQADYYKSAGVDLSRVSALDSAAKNPDSNGVSYNRSYPGAPSSYVQPSEQTANNSVYNPSSYNSQRTDNSYSNYTYQTTRNDGYPSGTVENPSESKGSDATVSNAVGANAVGYNTVGYNATQSNVGGYYNDGSNTTAEAITGGTNTGVSSPETSTAGASDQYSSHYGEANNPSAVSAYASSYGQQATSKDTTDNTVPNGIENQTSYEMNPDASTAQYGNNQPATT